MAYIQPKRQFAGSEVNTGNDGDIIKPSVRQISLKAKDLGSDGVWLLFLPAYKEGGAWYRQVRVRDNFGDKFKHRYVIPENDPVSYFEKRFRSAYPEEPRSWDEKTDKGTFKRYANYGRVTTRILFNAVKLHDMDKGCHVLNAPVFGCGDSIVNFSEKENPVTKQKRELICDPHKAIPVCVNLSGMKYSLDFAETSPIQIPEPFMDADNLYNLDNVCEMKTEDQIMEILREAYHPDIVAACMEGYEGDSGVVLTTSQPPISSPTHQEPVKNPVEEEPKFNIPTAVINPPSANIEEDQIEVAPIITKLPQNPMLSSSEAPPQAAQPSSFSTEDAIKFLSKKD